MDEVRGGSVLRRRSSVLCAVVVALLAAGSCCAVPAVGATGSGAATTPNSSLAPPAAVLPPDLVALEQKMQALPVTSEQVSFEATLHGLKTSGGGIIEVTQRKGKRRSRRSGKSGSRSSKGTRRARRGKGKSRAQKTGHGSKGGMPRSFPLFTGTGDIGVSPERAVLVLKALDALEVEAREVGGKAYLREPGISRIDGGRPWLSVSRAELEQADGFSSTPGMLTMQGEHGMFGQLIEELAEAKSVTEVGEATVDGQATTEFAAELDLAKMEKGRLAHQPKTVRKAALEMLRKTTMTLDVFIEPDGLPVRMSALAEFGKGFSMTVQSDIVATNVVFTVVAPPAKETISAAQLKKVQRRRARRQEARTRRKLHACLKRLRHEHKRVKSKDHVVSCPRRFEAPMRTSPQKSKQ